MNTSFSGRWIPALEILSGRKFTGTDTSSIGLTAFPAAGLAIGIVCAFFAWTCRTLTGAFAGSVVSGIVLSLAVEIFQDWRGLRTLTSFGMMILSGFSAPEALFAEKKTAKRITPVFLFAGIYLLRLLAFCVVVYRGETGSFIPVFTASMLIRGKLFAAAPENGEPALETDRAERSSALLFTAAVFLFGAMLTFRLNAFAHAALIGLTGFGMYALFRKFLFRGAGFANLRTLDVSGYASETILLLVSMIG